MSLKDNIRKILNEDLKGGWSTETRGLTPKEQAMFRMAEGILKQRHSQLVEHNKKREAEGTAQDGYPNDYDEFIQLLKSHFPKYDYFHQIHVMINMGTFKNVWMIPEDYAIKLLTEYILNYKNEGEQQRVDIVKEYELWDYVKEQYFDCSDDFFEHIWDNVLSGRRNYWNEDIKDRMWNEIQYEVEERMEDEEWQEENGTEFDDIIQEESYFHTYWHYPLQSLGWDRLQLCDFYREYINEDDLINYLFDKKSNVDTKHNAWGKFDIGELGKTYIINRNKLFW